MRATIDKVMLQQGEPAELFKAANDQINAMFQ
jgi:hypothetical protein